MGKRAAIVLVVAVVLAGGIAGAWVIRTAALSTASQEACEAVDENNEILRELVVHVRNRSIASIKTGVTKDLQPADVRAFYNPTIRRIDEVSC